MLQGCVHHWYIDAEGKGKCKKCGAIRDFRALRAKERNDEFWELEGFYIPTEGVKLAGVTHLARMYPSCLRCRVPTHKLSSL